MPNMGRGQRDGSADRPIQLVRTYVTVEVLQCALVQEFHVNKKILNKKKVHSLLYLLVLRLVSNIKAVYVHNNSCIISSKLSLNGYAIYSVLNDSQQVLVISLYRYSVKQLEFC